MPAKIGPDHRMFASLQVVSEQTGKTRILCDEHPDWKPDLFFDVDVAMADATRHNLHFHDEAPVEMVAVPGPLDSAYQMWRSAERSRQAWKLASIFYASFLAVLGLVAQDPDRWFTQLLWAAIIGVYTFLWGMYAGTAQQRKLSYVLLHQTLAPGDDNGS